MGNGARCKMVDRTYLTVPFPWCLYLDKGNGEKIAKGHKASFCLEDTKCYPGYDKKFNCSVDGGQGISPGCYDLYSWRIDCQWVDCTDFPHGSFYLRVHLNPGNQVAESDFRNNVAKCPVYDYGSWVISTSCVIGKTVILTKRFHVVVRLFSNRSQMMSKCGTNKKRGTPRQYRSVSLMFLPHFEVFCKQG